MTVVRLHGEFFRETEAAQAFQATCRPEGWRVRGGTIDV